MLGRVRKAAKPEEWRMGGLLAVPLRYTPLVSEGLGYVSSKVAHVGKVAAFCGGCNEGRTGFYCSSDEDDSAEPEEVRQTQELVKDN